MKTFRVTLFLCCCAAAIQLAISQTTTDPLPGPDCSDIGDGVQPITGIDLQVCPDIRVEERQCCTLEYIRERLTEAEMFFVDGLRDELQERFRDIRQALRMLREHLNGTFVDNYFERLSSFNIFSAQDSSSERDKRSLAGRLRAFRDELRERLENRDNSSSDESDEFDGRGFVDRVVGDSVRNAVSLLGGGGAEDLRECVRDAVQEHIKDRNEEINGRGLENIRRSMEAIVKIEDLLDDLTERLAGFQPLQQCVETLVRLNTCGRCLLPRPAFCRNVCGALARACYSPFQNAFNDELERLYGEIRRVVDVTDDTLGKLEETDLIDATPREVFAEIREKCSLDIADIIGDRTTDAPDRDRRQDSLTTTEEEVENESPTDREDGGEDDSSGRLRIPSLIQTLVMRLRGGPFNYPGRGFPQLCRRLGAVSGNCWGGNDTLVDDIAEFTADDIEGQVDNPVIQIPQSDLQAAAQALGTPISDAIDSPEFQEVAPQILDIQGEENGSGAKELSLSIAGLTLSVFVVAFRLWTG